MLSSALLFQLQPSLNRVQTAQKAAAPLFNQSNMRSRNTPILHSLQWQPKKFCIKSKFWLYLFKPEMVVDHCAISTRPWQPIWPSGHLSRVYTLSRGHITKHNLWDAINHRFLCSLEETTRTVLLQTGFWFDWTEQQFYFLYLSNFFGTFLMFLAGFPHF